MTSLDNHTKHKKKTSCNQRNSKNRLNKATNHLLSKPKKQDKSTRTAKYKIPNRLITAGSSKTISINMIIDLLCTGLNANEITDIDIYKRKSHPYKFGGKSHRVIAITKKNIDISKNGQSYYSFDEAIRKMTTESCVFPKGKKWSFISSNKGF